MVHDGQCLKNMEILPILLFHVKHFVFNTPTGGFPSGLKLVKWTFSTYLVHDVPGEPNKIFVIFSYFYSP